MNIVQILCKLHNVYSFLADYPSDFLPRPITETCTFIVTADPQTEGGSHWLAIHFRPKSSSPCYFDSYGIVPFVPNILAFIKRNCTTWDHNEKQLQSLTIDVCGKYFCLFPPTWIGGYILQQFVVLFSTGDAADLVVERMFTAKFGAEMPRGAWDQCCRSCL